MFNVLETIGGFFAKGGVFMWPLLVCSIVSLTVITLGGTVGSAAPLLPLGRGLR